MQFHFGEGAGSAAQLLLHQMRVVQIKVHIGPHPDDFARQQPALVGQHAHALEHRMALPGGFNKLDQR